MSIFRPFVVEIFPFVVSPVFVTHSAISISFVVDCLTSGISISVSASASVVIAVSFVFSFSEDCPVMTVVDSSEISAVCVLFFFILFSHNFLALHTRFDSILMYH